jgi:hypothetical protein
MPQEELPSPTLMGTWLISEVTRNAVNSPEKKGVFDAKIRHIVEVVQITQKLIEMMGGKIEGTEENWNSQLAQAIAEIHDIARFEELAEGQINKSDTHRYKHAYGGAKKFAAQIRGKNRLPGFAEKFNELGFDYKTIFEAVLQHSAKDYVGNNPYAYLIRDADKTAICSDIDRLCKEDFIQHEKLVEGDINPDAWKEFLETRKVSNSKVHTLADGLLRQFCWYDDLHFNASKKIWDEGDIRAKILERMKQEPVNADYLQSLQTKYMIK